MAVRAFAAHSHRNTQSEEAIGRRQNFASCALQPYAVRVGWQSSLLKQQQDHSTLRHYRSVGQMRLKAWLCSRAQSGQNSSSVCANDGANESRDLAEYKAQECQSALRVGRNRARRIAPQCRRRHHRRHPNWRCLPPNDKPAAAR